MRALVGLTVLALTTPLLVGCNAPPPVVPPSPRYQIAQIGDSGVVRLDTHTGEMRRYVVVIGGDVAAPSEMQTVRDTAEVSDCAELGYVNKDVAQDLTAVKGGNTVLFAKNTSGENGAWAYRCPP